MHTLSLPYPDDLLVTSGKAPQALEEELAFLLAAKLFEVHRLSLGKAAEFCRMSKLRFMFELGRLQIPVMNLDDDQIADELRDDQSNYCG
jgi:predicted HTH domain antitoxin